LKLTVTNLQVLDVSPSAVARRKSWPEGHYEII
jgi:hypothetical protein